MAIIKRTITKYSIMARKELSMEVEATAEQWAAYDGGQAIQHALPHLDKGIREFMISGTTPEQWLKLFPPEDDEE